MDNVRPSDHRQFYQFKLLVFLLALLALAVVIAWVVMRGGGTQRLQALLGAPSPTATQPMLSAVQRVALTATAEAQATAAASVATQTAEAAVVVQATAAAQATATAEVQAAATQTTVAIVLATQTAKAMTAAEAATPTPTEVATETPPPQLPAETPTEEVAGGTPSPEATPEAAQTPELTPTPVPVEIGAAEATPETAPTAAQEFQYSVRWGDTVTTLARQFNTSVGDIVQRNNLADPDHIRVGETLTILGTPPAPPVDYIVQHGDTLWAIAARFSTTVSAITRLNRITNPDRIWAGQTLRIVPGALVAQPDYRGYTVRRGDTLWAIALRHGTTPWAIAIVNNLANPNLIFAGQVLRVP